jgi:hypothetical protein
MAKMRSYNTKGRKLDTAQVQEMYQRLLEGETQGSLAREYGISVIQVGRIARGESRAIETGANDRPVPNHQLQTPQLDVEGFESRIAARVAQTNVAKVIPPAVVIEPPAGETAMERMLREVNERRLKDQRANEQLGELDKGDSER